MVPPVASDSSSGWACTSSSLRPAVVGTAVTTATLRPSDQRLLLGVVAGDGVPLAAVDQLRDVLHAALALAVGQLGGELRAARAEPAAAGRVGRAGQVADHGDPLAG